MPNRKYKNVMMKEQVHADLSDFAAALGCSRAEAIARLLKMQTVIGYLQEYIEKCDGSNHEAYAQILSWFELAGLVKGEG